MKQVPILYAGLSVGAKVALGGAGHPFGQSVVKVDAHPPKAGNRRTIAGIYPHGISRGAELQFVLEFQVHVQVERGNSIWCQARIFASVKVKRKVQCV